MLFDVYFGQCFGETAIIFIFFMMRLALFLFGDSFIFICRLQTDGCFFFTSFDKAVNQFMTAKFGSFFQFRCIVFLQQIGGIVRCIVQACLG